jgi:hypothetical protein
MKYFLLLVALLLLLAIGGGCSSARSAQDTEATTAVVATSSPDISNRAQSTIVPVRSSVPSLDQVPMYPNARDKSATSNEAPAWSSASFQTSDALDKVVQYYKEQLPTQGWTLTEETPDSQALTFLWTDPEKAPLDNFELHVLIENRAEVQTHVRLLMRHWSDPTEIPLYRDATNIKVDYFKDPNLDELWQHVTVYETGARPEELETYYRNLLQSLGWEYEQVSGPISSPGGISFVYVRGTSFVERKGGRVLITAEVENIGLTKVTLTAYGYDIKPPVTPEQ